jgi:hypothetical protein
MLKPRRDYRRLDRKVTMMSSTIRLGWTDVLAAHAPTKPMWMSGVNKAIGLALVQLGTLRHAHHDTEPRRYYYLERALMGREMYRL